MNSRKLEKYFSPFFKWGFNCIVLFCIKERVNSRTFCFDSDNPREASSNERRPEKNCILMTHTILNSTSR